jgi:hypothetical protein
MVEVNERTCRMKRLLLAAFAALAFTAPASAQYYGSPYHSPPYQEWQPGPRYYEYDRPSYGYRPEPHYERRVYRYERPRYETRRVVRYGQVCVTSRGSCEYPQSYPLGTGCRCDIPGFGPKRGNINY